MITAEQLIKLGASPENANKYVAPLNQACDKYLINTNARICQFLAQVFHESGNLKRVSENLNYSAEALLKFFPSKVKTMAEAKAIERNTKAIDEKVYGNMSGKGLIQITGLVNYQAVSRGLGVNFVEKPYLLEQPLYACLSAGWYWHCFITANHIADLDSEDTVKTITKLVNGRAMLGLEERIQLWKKAKGIWK